MTLNDFDYPLPAEAIARYPLAERDLAKMLLLPKVGNTLGHLCVQDLPSCLSRGDLLVLNNVRVMPCRLLGYKIRHDQTLGCRSDVILLEPLNTEQTHWQAFLKPAKRLPPATRILLDDEQNRGAHLTINRVPTSDETGENLVPGEVTLELGQFSSAGELFEAIGQMPLPPYLGREPEALDKTTYQTSFSESHPATHRQAGGSEPSPQSSLMAQAAPTAGLHFTPRVFDGLSQHGIQVAYVTLAVGAGTFLPVKTQDIQHHKLHSEQFFAPAETLTLINQTKRQGGRVIAVGTTVVRTLEAIARDLDPAMVTPELPETDQAGASDLFIRPGFQFRVIDGLLTNFHLPKSTLLMLVSALLEPRPEENLKEATHQQGYQRLLASYQEALRLGYRFFSYGDCMLILPSLP
ncbi:MAG: tRNA preQ1(34) S-adenosylmethionine ribosyltransferase-isomerase QueA [Vampirovibrionales bacterium]|nr:tRNA preQ1(34) S-adenosylmethionine ribosyltransferase-isomerase QueA [Vampirovibrionales bacterium]